MRVYDAEITLCSLFSNFDIEATLIFQEAVGEHRAAQRIAFSPFSLLVGFSVFVRLLFDCFYTPILFLLPPPPDLAVLPTLCVSILSVRFPPSELRICQTSHFFLHSLVPLLLYSHYSLLFPRSRFSLMYTIYRGFIGVLSLYSLPPPSSNPFLSKSPQVSFKGPQRRPWKGARRKGCGRPHCSTLLCCADSSL